MRVQLPNPEPDIPGLLDVIEPLGGLVAGIATIGTVAACVGFLVLAVVGGLLGRDITPGGYSDAAVNAGWWGAGGGTLVALLFGGVLLRDWAFLAWIGGTVAVIIAIVVVRAFLRRRRW